MLVIKESYDSYKLVIQRRRTFKFKENVEVNVSLILLILIYRFDYSVKYICDHSKNKNKKSIIPNN